MFYLERDKRTPFNWSNRYKIHLVEGFHPYHVWSIGLKPDDIRSF